MQKVINKDIRELLPHRPPFLFVDKVLSVDGNKITATKTIKKDEYYLKGHFPGRPIVPGVLIIESMAQAAGIIVSHVINGEKADKKQADVFYLSRVADMKFKTPVFPRNTMVIKAEVMGQFANSAKVSVKSEVDGKIVAEGELTLSKK